MSTRRIATRARIIASGQPRGYQLLADFIDAVDAERLPDTAETRALHAAFWRILDGEAADKALRLRRGRGEKRGLTIADMDKKYGKIYQFIARQLREDTKRGALARAVQSAAGKFKKTPRRVEAIWAQYAPVHRIAMRLAVVTAPFEQVSRLIDSAAVAKLVKKHRRKNTRIK